MGRRKRRLWGEGKKRTKRAAQGRRKERNHFCQKDTRITRTQKGQLGPFKVPIGSGKCRGSKAQKGEGLGHRVHGKDLFRELRVREKKSSKRGVEEPKKRPVKTRDKRI